MKLLAPLVLLLAAPRQDATDAHSTAVAAPRWTPTVLLDAKTKLGGCAIGELDPQTEGLEVAAVAGDGGVWLARRTPEGWRGERIASLPGEAIQCTIGDVDPRGEGNEIVCVGMRNGTEDDGGQGAAYVVRRDDGKWRVERVFTDDALLHGVGIAGQASSPRAFLATGFTNQVFSLEWREDGWTMASIVDLPGAGKNVIATGPGSLAVACNDGSLVAASAARGGWVARVVNERAAGRARLGMHGDSVVVADDDGVLALFGRDGLVEVLRTEGKLRGALSAELDAERDGHELATAGYGGRVLIAARAAGAEGEWSFRVVHEAKERFHHLAAADLDGEPGDELVVCGYSGQLVLLTRP